jgi:hypothetical protein
MRLRRGRLQKQPCLICGNPKAQAHHHDYSKPLEIDWLCQVCHDKVTRGVLVLIHGSAASVTSAGR